MKILVVEDNDGNRFALTELLLLQDYEVISVSCGRDAVQILRTDKFDIILCDITMPGVTGFNVIQEAKRLHPETPFVFVSAHATNIDQKIGYSLGADRYITKPYSINEILKTIKDLTK